MRKYVGLLVAGLALAACSSDPELREASYGPYLLVPGDTVRIVVDRQPDMSGEATVTETGMITLPLIGTVKAAELQSGELAERIKQAAIEQGFLVNPDVSVYLISGDPIYVMGEVENPGPYQWRPGMDVKRVLATAGGATYRGTETVIIERDGEEWKADRSTPLQPGDVVRVPERFL